VALPPASKDSEEVLSGCFDEFFVTDQIVGFAADSRLLRKRVVSPR
jgi:hypothetical protein